MPIASLWHPEEANDTLAHRQRLIEGGPTERFQNRYRHKDGSYRWLSWSSTAEGGFIYAVGRDVTAEREAAHALQRAEEQLRQAQKMEAVGQLTGGIAHDFNNLLTGIIGALDLIRKRSEQGRFGEIERYLTLAKTSANRAASLTHRLLAFARRQPLDPRAVDVDALVGSMEDLLRRTLGEQIALRIVASDAPWRTFCDPHQLESALLNLAINARDAMPDGGTLTIETANADATRPRAGAARRRAGRICPHRRHRHRRRHAARRCARGRSIRSSPPSRWGRGPGSASRWCTASRISPRGMRASSRPKAAARPCSSICRATRGAVADAPGAAAAGAAHRAQRGETVLVIEDEASVRELVIEVLNDLGYRALEAADGPAGLQLLRAGERIDLLVTDVGLPGMNGRQVAEAARALRPGLKVLFITGYAESAALCPASAARTSTAPSVRSGVMRRPSPFRSMRRLRWARA